MKQEKLINTLPEGWIFTELGNVSHINMGQSPPSSTYNTKKIGLPFFQGKSGFGEIYPKIEKYCSVPLKTVDAEDVLISVRAPIGPTNLAKTQSCIGRGLAGIKGFGGISSKFILYQLRSTEKELEKFGTGTTFKAISKNILETFPFLLPPLEEQHRIIARIEELFSELDHAEEGLKKAQKQLEVYRQALLKSAFEGKLTEKWREENIPKSYWTLKGEDVFFKKIQIINPNKGLPTGWFYATLGSLSNNYDHQRKPLSSNERKEHKSNYPYYGATEIIDYVNEYLFDGKYILIGEDGANLFSKNKSLSIIVNGRFWVNNHAHVIQTNESEVNMEFLSLYFNTLDLKSYISGTAQPKLNKFALNSIPIVVCSIEEQNKIVQELDTKFTLIDNLNSVITESINKIVISRQSILKKAFEGRLTQQSSNDESVFELISRIRKDKQTYLEKLKIDEKEKPKRKATMEKSNLSVKDVLKNQSEPISVKQIWKQSKFQDDSNIDLFYAELKELEDSIFIELEGKETLIAWRNENQ